VESTENEKLDLDRLRRQDAREFARLVAVYQRFVLGMAQSLGLSGADCDDAAAETFAIAYRALPKFRGDAQLSTWLYRIGYRTALKVRHRYPQTLSPTADTAETHALRPEETMAVHETHEAIWQAVARLDSDQAIAVELFYRRLMSVEEVAAVMQKPEGTVKTLLFRARERLRTLLKPLEKS
jgi:RNA polymerase sigma-70 factor, ECF subfamily